MSDNLGNTRNTLSTKTGVAVSTQKDDYYPFGLEINRSLLSPKNEYLYNKKELQEELQQYDYGARFYDPVIGRWTTPDPLAEKLPGWSPYNYVLNNPLKLFDPDGAFPFPVTVRSFAPTNAFAGTGFGDDRRGYSASNNVTSRISQTTTIDPTAGTVTGGFVTSSDTHWNGIYVGNATDNTDEGGIDRIFRPGGNDIGVGEHYSGSNPAFGGAAPDIVVNSAISLSENDKEGYVNATVVLSGTQFPATEATIGDKSGQSVFLTGAAALGNVTTLNKGDKQLSSVSVRINIDGKGNFTGVVSGDKTYSIADWNKAQTAKPATQAPPKDKPNN